MLNSFKCSDLVLNQIQSKALRAFFPSILFFEEEAMLGLDSGLGAY